MIFHYFYSLLGLLTMGASVSCQRAESKSHQLAIRSVDSTKEDLTLAANMNWASLLHPAPKILAVLSQLIVLTGKAPDFSLMDKAKVTKFEHIKDPGSFAGTMTQLVNEAKDAFLLAHGNMGKISDFLKNVPGNVDHIIIFLQKAPVLFLRKMIATPRDAINTTSKQCVELASATVKKFESVSNLIDEIIEVGRIKQGATMQLKTDKEIDANLTQQDLDAAKAQGQNYLKMVNESRTKLEISQQECEKAIESLPTSWTLIGQGITKMFADSVINIFQSLADALSHKIRAGSEDGGKGAGQTQPGDQQSPASGAHFGELLSSCNDLLGTVEKIPVKNPTFQEPEEKTLEAARGMIEKSRYVFGTCRNSLDSFPADDSKKKGMQLTSQVDDILQELKDAQVMQFQVLQKALVRKSQEISELVQSIVFKVKPGDKPPAAASQMSREQMRVQFEQLQLEESKKAYKENLENLRENDRKLSQLTHDIAKLNFTITNLKSVIEVLKTCLLHVSELQTHWTKLQEFFMFVDSKIESTLGENKMMDNFIKSSQVIEGVITQSDSTAPIKRDFYLQVLLQDQNETKRRVQYLHTLTHSYYKVSETYLMPRVSAVNQLPGNDGEAAVLLQQLADQGDQDIKGIDAIINQELKDYENRVSQAKQSLQPEDKSPEQGINIYLEDP